MIDVEGSEVLALITGSGPPLLMLHGDPQTHLCWHAIAPALTGDFTVVPTDIRGRGEGHIAPATKDARLYSKRAMADEQVSAMQALGFSRFSLVGQDRDARLARRLTLDHHEAVERLVVLDIVPALNLYENFSAEVLLFQFPDTTYVRTGGVDRGGIRSVHASNPVRSDHGAAAL